MDNFRIWSSLTLLVIMVQPAYLQTCSTLNCQQLCIQGNPDSCGCEIGFRVSTANPTACTDINECEEDSNICANAPQGNICINTDGGYFCSGCTALSSSGNIWSYYNSSECCLRDTNSQCGQSINNEGRIVGGYPAAAGRWPWIASLEVTAPDFNIYGCGGSLLTATHVVTAAHCLRFSVGDATSVVVRMGLLDVGGSTLTNVHEQRFISANFVIHPNYQDTTSDANDVAVITLPQAATLGKYVNVICLPNGETPPDGQICYAAGWGATSFGGSSSNALLEVDLPIVSGQACSNVYSTHIQASEICTGHPEGGKDTCQGDSGGPLMCQRCNSCDWYLVGITSYGIGCAQPNIPGVYARVSFFQSWIIQQTNQAAVTDQECVKPSWSDWSSWTTCSLTCGGGMQTRNRTCNNGNPGDPGCFGVATETQNCSTQACASWSDWTSWTTCSLTCGGGTQTRNRTCNNGNPGDPGCFEGITQTVTRSCNTQACPTDPCNPNPCENGGTCAVVNNQTNCNCTSGFTGDNCQTPVTTPCNPNPCQNGGTCSVVNNQTSCACTSNYTGNNCETTVTTPCNPNPCQNGGTCVFANNQTSCACTSNYTGNNCETTVTNPCNPNPCQNGGTCSVVNNQTSCACTSSYTGNNCETTVIACSTLNCQQLCIQGSPDSCGCEIGFRVNTTNPTACTDINECEEDSNICANASQGNVCINTDGGYFCSGCTALSSSGNIWSYYNSSECCLRDTNSQCGQSINNEGRIVGGYPAAAGRWPWIARLLITAPDGNRYICGGSLLTATHVVTAAHCLRFAAGDATSVVVRLGLLDVDGTTITNVHEQNFTSTNIVIHPNYGNTTSFENDVAVITLPQAATLGKYVNVICLPNGETPPVGQICYAAGWGTTSSGGSTSNVLLEVDLPIVSGQACSNVYSTHIQASEICTGYPEGGKDTCQGDSGGPLMCQRCNSCDWYLVGITSYGIGCAEPNIPGVYARVSFLQSWIIQQTNQVAVTDQECVKPSWSDWSSWTTCSFTCGGGTQTRNRTCNNGNPGDPGCFGVATETQSCNIQACPTGLWSQWSSCSGQCGSTIEYRTRNCHEGGDCMREERPCDPCQGTWSTWSEVRSCPVNCGGGMRFFARECDGTVEPEECGIERRAESCNTEPCCEGLADSFPGCCAYTLENCQYNFVQNSCSLSCCRKREGLNCENGGIGADCDRELSSVYCFILRSKCMESAIQSLCPSTCSNQGSCVCRDEQRLNNLCS